VGWRFQVERALVAQRVANELFATEAAIDEALIRASKLMGEMISARKELGLSAVFADDAVASVNETLSKLTAARSAVVAGHHQLEESRLRLGVRTKMTGVKPPQSSAVDRTRMQQVG
jgi:hypothetical protein